MTVEERGQTGVVARRPAGAGVATGPVSVAVDRVSAGYGSQPALTDVSLEVRPGSLLAVIGPNGAGKSTLINLLAPDARAQVGEVSQALNSGRHTTTTTQWYWLDDARTTALIDSPGFQEFGLRQIKAAELAGHMRDLREPARECRFYNCSHRHEPGCGVRAALARGAISASRYRIYTELWAELS